MMNSKIYRQTNSKWNSLPYPTKASSFGGNGCGACSVLHCIIEQEKYKDWTPKKIQPYMKEHAVEGQGTTWSGIKEGLKHFGMKNVKWFDRSAPMSDVWTELNKKNRVGVILFVKTDGYGNIIRCTGPDGTCWTAGGHYVAFLDYKIKDKKHYFYMKDSGDRKNDGWFCYETSMKGCCSQVWTCTVPKEVKEEEPKKEETVKTTYLKDMVAFAETLCHPLGTKKTKWEYETGAPLATYKTACKTYMHKTSKISMSDCGYFINTVARAKGPSDSTKTLAGTKEPFPKMEGYKVVFKGKKIPDSEIKRGRIVRYKTTNGRQHTLMLWDKGVVAEAGRESRFPVIHKSTKYNTSNVDFSTLEVLEPIEKAVKK